MLSIVIAFRFTRYPHKEAIVKTFNYWEMVRDIYNLDLVFINDFSQDLWIEKDFIHEMRGDKVDWNQSAARNYGAELARGDKIIFTDIDHIMYGNFQKLEDVDITKSYLVFPRLYKNKDGINERIHTHCNTFLIKKDDFINYDEDFRGNYGYEDTEFFFRLNKTHKKILIEDSVKAYLTNLRSTGLSKNLTINKVKLFQKTNIFHPEINDGLSKKYKSRWQ